MEGLLASTSGWFFGGFLRSCMGRVGDEIQSTGCFVFFMHLRTQVAVLLRS